MEIQDLKQRLTILEVAERLGIQVDKHGKARCPFHDDKKPSLQFSKEKNICTCFSARCGAGTMDIITLTEKYLKLSTHEAINQLKEWAGAIPSNGRNPAAKAKPEPPYPKLFGVFKANLQKSKKAKNYLKERGLDSEELQAGFNHSTWPQMKGCVIFPLKDRTGDIMGLYGRSINGQSEARHLYNKGRKGLYPEYPLPATKELLLTESIIDAATLQQAAGIASEYGILACYGTNGFTAEHQEAIQSLPELESVTIFFDGDQAGKEGVRRTAELLHQIRPQLKVFYVDTPEGEDINSLAQSHETEVFTHLLASRKPFFPSPEDLSIGRHEEASQTQGTIFNTDNPQLLTYLQEGLLISVLGGIRTNVLDRLRVTLKIEPAGNKNPLYSLRHSLDLYYDDQVEKLIRKAAERLGTGTRQLQIAIAGLTEALEAYRLEQSEKKRPKAPGKRKISPERKKKAIGFMKREGYFRELNELIGCSGVVGEENNRLVLWITYATRKRADPLHVICLGASGTGKTYLQEKVSGLVPEEDKISGTAISENALYYAQNLNLAHKLFIIEDLDGASNILYALRELQTKKSISKMVTQKDSRGNLRTEVVTVQGPICLTATTTKERLYEDNANRCLLIYLDGGKAQQEAIMDDQRKRSAGKINKKEQQEIKELLRDIQALYKPVAIRNPYAEQLRIPETVFKPLRTNSHYLAFIEGITFCNQYQRAIKTDPDTGEKYITTTIGDIELAGELMKDVLLAKSDELTKACRGFFEAVKGHMGRAGKRSFYKHDVRAWMRINPNNLKYYLSQLQQYGYLKVVGGNKYKQGYEYEVTDLEEYERLHGTLLNALDEALIKIKAANEAAVGNSG